MRALLVGILNFELKILRMRGFSLRFWTMDLKFPVQGFSGPLSQKSDENPRMRVIPHSKFPPKCAHAPILVAFFVTTDLKNPVYIIIDIIVLVCLFVRTHAQ